MEKNVPNWIWPLTGMILVRGELKQDFVKAAASGAVRLRWCPLKEL